MARTAKIPAAAHTHTIAEQTDRYQIYQQAVQSSCEDVALLQEVYQQARGSVAHHFREDFCGTAATLRAWLQQGDAFSGEGVDIDPEPIAWGEQHNFQSLDAHERERAHLHVGDARMRSTRAPDIRCAFNFSYWIFRERALLLEYFRAVHTDLAADGVFVIDLHGGAEVFSEEEEVTDFDTFEMVCHQTDVCPVDHSAHLALHFRFPDGSEIHNAFEYDWRIWSMPEIIDVLHDAGFKDVRCHWYIDDEDSDEDPHYELTRIGYNDLAWIACLAALK